MKYYIICIIGSVMEALGIICGCLVRYSGATPPIINGLYYAGFGMFLISLIILNVMVRADQIEMKPIR